MDYIENQCLVINARPQQSQVINSLIIVEMRKNGNICRPFIVREPVILTLGIFDKLGVATDIVERSL